MSYLQCHVMYWTPAQGRSEVEIHSPPQQHQLMSTMFLPHALQMQEEAAQRLVSSKPGDADFRAMNIRVQLYAEAKYQFRISRFKYYPVPGVDGALVTFKLRPSSKWPQLPSHRAFHNFVAQAFSGRRKMLRNSLQPLYSAQQVGACNMHMGLGMRTG